MIKRIPPEIVQQILVESKKLTNFQLLALTCHHFNNMILIPKFQNFHKIIPNFIFSEKWAKVLYNHKTKLFAIPEKYQVYNIVDLYIKLICENSIFPMKMLLQQGNQCSESLTITLDKFKNCFKNQEDYLDFCKIERIKFDCKKMYTFKYPLLIFTYLFGNKNMLELLLELNMIKNIDFNNGYLISTEINDNMINFIYQYEFKNINFAKCNKQFRIVDTNIKNLINNYDIKNGWNMKNSNYKETLFPYSYIKFYVYNISDMFIKLICDNSLTEMKILAEQKIKCPESLIMKIERFKTYFKNEDNYLDFCEVEGLELNPRTAYTFNYFLLVFTYLFGTKDMLELLLESNMIENIDLSVNYIKCIIIEKNILYLINKYDLKNNWNIKDSVYKKVLFPTLNEIIVKSAKFSKYISDLKIILETYPKSFYDMDMIASLISDIKSYDKNNIYENITGIKIKHQILIIADFNHNEKITKLIFGYLEWNNADIEVINKLNFKYLF
jgi:hypothetical protein